MSVLLSTAYLAPVLWYAVLADHRHAVIDIHEHYIKQTYRNRCRIVMPNGPVDLVIPIQNPSSHSAVRDLRISDHGNWRHHHWNALRTAYGKTPFFEFYADDLAPFYHERRYEFLLDFNEALQQTICSLIELDVSTKHSTTYYKSESSNPFDVVGEGLHDCRALSDPHTPLCDAPAPVLKPYYQVFAQRLGFQPNMSMIDLLFNMGPESILVL